MTGNPNQPGCNPGLAGGINQQLQVVMSMPAKVGVGNVFPINIVFGNGGNVDIPIPTRFIVSEDSVPIALTIPDLSNNTYQVYVEFREAGGPANVLRAGASGVLVLYGRGEGGAHELKYFSIR
jgi:hypothetical protein